ncbi:hypothetical protein DYB35_006196 [Aphanomyces astaci]|nr:hypothetical protein DYB35_006196 [Aphanomyces astaci]
MALETAIDVGITEDSFLARDGEAALRDFAERVRTLMTEHDIDLIINADQTGVNYEYLPAKLIHKKGDKTIWIKCGKKYPLFLVLKTGASKIKAVVQENLTHRHGFGKQVWKQVEPFQNKFGCRLYGNPTAWWNSGICVDFLKFHFTDRPDRATKKVLLL